MPHDVKAHKALVTGGARGIGLAICRALESRAIAVVAPSRSSLDVLDPAYIERFAAEHSAEGIDILVNNAGINLLNAFERVQDQDWAAMLQVNVTAPFKLIQAFAPHMAAAGWGRIVNVSSIFSIVSRECRAAYSAAKSALNGLTRAAAVELAPKRILVNAVCPGYVNTELTAQNNSPADLQSIARSIPLGRLAEPCEIAAVAAFLCSDENGYITGQTIVADGGFVCQ
jgi:3-oxoacyl-[acyl-carrier protein] reductase